MQTPEQILAEAKKWRSIYPAYIDSSLTCAQGRRLGKSRCVLYPQLLEISEALQKLKLQHVVEGHKRYSKDLFKVGRIKVRILTDAKVPINSNIKCKHALLKQLAILIGSNQNRKIVKPPYAEAMEVEKQKKVQTKKKTKQ